MEEHNNITNYYCDTPCDVEIDINNYNSSNNNILLVHQYLSKLVLHIYLKQKCKHYINLQTPELIAENLAQTKNLKLGENISEFDLYKNYNSIFNLFLKKICSKPQIKFSYCDIFHKSIKEYIYDSYKLKENIDYNNFLNNMKSNIKNSIIEVLEYMDNNVEVDERLFLWKSNRLLIVDSRSGYFSFHHPLYNIFRSINRNDVFTLKNKNFDLIADKLIQGKAILYDGCLMLPEDFGLDLAIDELNYHDVIIKFVNRCFQELISGGSYDLQSRRNT